MLHFKIDVKNVKWKIALFVISIMMIKFHYKSGSFKKIKEEI